MGGFQTQKQFMMKISLNTFNYILNKGGFQTKLFFSIMILCLVNLGNKRYHIWLN